MDEWLDKNTSSERGISKKRLSLDGADVDMETIRSKEYLARFDGITENETANDRIKKCIVAMLEHRSGTAGEDLYLVSAIDGTVKGKNVASKVTLAVDVNKSILDAVRGNPPGTLVGIHNHPSNIPPTGSDFEAAGARKYKMGISVLHNGDAYAYAAGDTPISGYLFDLNVARLVKKGYNETEAIERVMNDFERRFGISWRKL